MVKFFTPIPSLRSQALECHPSSGPDLGPVLL